MHENHWQDIVLFRQSLVHFMHLTSEKEVIKLLIKLERP